MFLYIFCSIVCGFVGHQPEGNSVWGALAWKSLGTPGMEDSIYLYSPLFYIILFVHLLKKAHALTLLLFTTYF